MPRKFVAISIIFLLNAFILSSCQGQAPMVSTETAAPLKADTPQPSVTPFPSATPLPTLTATPTATPAPLGCPDLKGKVELRQMEDQIIGKPLTVNIYTPPCYSREKSGGYPVLFLLHGQSYTASQWVDLGVPGTADRLTSSGQLAPFLVVMPQEDYYLADFPKSKFGESITDLLLPWIRQEYNTCTLRECTAIGGLSRGAIWAVTLGLQNGDVFGAIGAHSLASNPFQVFILRDLLKTYPDKPRIYLDSGNLDLYLKNAAGFEETLNELHIQHIWIIRDGAHNDQYWASHVEEYLRWYAAPWKKQP